jgi:hypothetical protein
MRALKKLFPSNFRTELDYSGFTVVSCIDGAVYLSPHELYLVRLPPGAQLGAPRVPEPPTVGQRVPTDEGHLSEFVLICENLEAEYLQMKVICENSCSFVKIERLIIQGHSVGALNFQNWVEF